jgi:membrane-bound lytic murein transglycosylase D
MVCDRLVTSVVIAAAVSTVAACGSAPRAQMPAATPPVAARQAVPAPPPPPPDPVAALLATSTRHFEQGERELALGHLTSARLEFDRALEILLEAPLGIRADGRVRDHYDRLIDRISAHESIALAAGDGFAEKPAEAAPIDELLATSAFTTTPAPPELEAIKDVVTADLAANQHDIPIPLNERVLAYVELFQGRLRDWFEAGLRRGTQYLPMIQQVFRAEGLPLDLAYIPLIESAFKPTALSRAKAKGVWQFMRGTALENGLKHDWYIDERADPEKATRAAAKYLRTLNRMFEGDWHLAMASYNGGPGLVQRALKRSGATDFWDLSTGNARYLPRETREYVPMILAAIILARNPAQYGFDVVPETPRAFDVVTVSRPVDLRRVAEWTGASIDDIQALNPELRRWTTPVRSANYAIKVPEGTGARLQAKLAASPPTEFTALKWHTVKRGDTIASLARRFSVGRADLAEANGLSARSKLRSGQELVIPRAPTPLLSQRPAEARLARATAKSGTPARRLTYRVRSGDTLIAIARQFHVDVDDLKSWNGMRGSRLAVGDVLTIRMAQ